MRVHPQNASLRVPSERDSEGAPSHCECESAASIQMNLEDILRTQSQKQNVGETNVETSWDRAAPSSDKSKVAGIEVVLNFEMVLTFEVVLILR